MVRLLHAGFIAISTQLAAALAAAFTLFAVIRHWILPPEPPPRQRRSGKSNDDQTDLATRLAIGAVEKVFLRDLKWSFRRSQGSSNGIDARAEILDEGSPTGKLLPLQIRSVLPRKENAGDYIYRGKTNHLAYWTKHSLPVHVVTVDPESGQVLWQQVEKRLCEETETEWSIAIPATNVLDASARLFFDEAITSDPESLMRAAFALDRTLMEEIQDQTTFFVWDEWVDTSSTFCNLRIYIGESQQEKPDVEIDYHLRAHRLYEVMSKLFPWATYSYAEPIAEYSGVVAVHILEVELRPEAYAYIEAENFLEQGYPQEEEPLAPEPEDFVTEEDEREFWRRRGVSRGPQYDKEG
jgi:hypothetical protein